MKRLSWDVLVGDLRYRKWAAPGIVSAALVLSFWPATGYADVIHLTAPQTAAFIFSTYQQYKLTLMGDYSHVLDERTLVDLIRANPHWSSAQLRAALATYSADRRSLIQSMGLDPVPHTTQELGEQVVMLSGISVGVYIPPLVPSAAPAAGPAAALGHDVSMYESWVPADVRVEASQQIYDAQRQGEHFIEHLDIEVRSLRQKDHNAEAILDNLTESDLSIDMSLSPQAISSRDPTFASSQVIQELYQEIAPDQTLTVDTDVMRQRSASTLQLIDATLAKSNTNALDAATRRARKQEIASDSADIYLATTLLSLAPGETKLAKQISDIANAALKLATAIDDYDDDESAGYASSAVLTMNYFQFALVVFQAMASAGPSPDQIIFAELQQLTLFVQQFSANVMVRFDNVDNELRYIWTTMESEFVEAQYRSDLAVDSTVAMHNALATNSFRIGRLEAHLIQALRNQQQYDVIQNVDYIVHATPGSVTFPEFQRAALALDSFSESAVNAQPFVYTDPLNAYPADETIDLLGGDSAKGSAQGAMGGLPASTDLGGEINLVDQMARNASQALAPPLGNPSAWAFAGEEFLRLRASHPALWRRLPVGTEPRFIASAERILDQFNVVFGVPGDVGQAVKGRAILLRMLDDYDQASANLVAAIEQERQPFADANAKGVDFWLSRDGMVDQEGPRPYFSPPLTPIQFCPDWGTNPAMRRFGMLLPAETMGRIDPAFRLAARLGIIAISLCHYTHTDEFMASDHYLSFRVDAQAESVNLANLILTATDEGKEINYSLDAAKLWATKYSAVFASKAIPDRFEDERLAVRYFGYDKVQPWARWIYTCMDLDSPTDAMRQQCATMKKSFNDLWWPHPPTPVPYRTLVTANYELADYRQSILDRIAPVIRNYRKDYADQMASQLSSGTISDLVRILTLKKTQMLSILGVAYSTRLTTEDELRAIFWGPGQLLDGEGLLNYLKEDTSDGTRILTLGDEFSRRSAAARAELSRLGPANGLGEVNALLLSIGDNHAAGGARHP